METYTVTDIIKAGYTLKPLRCVFCRSLEVTYFQYIGDAHCAACGAWQLELEKSNDPI